MDTGTLNVKTIFGQERRHVVPLFQRPYVWNQGEQWEPLWEDLRNVVERLLRGQSTRPHFLGAIVLDQIRKPTGHIEARLVIDGQQRLTTIQLLLTAFRDACSGLGVERHHRSLGMLTTNDDPLSDDQDEAFKVWPTNADQKHFRAVMTCGTPLKLCQSYGHPHEVSSLGHPILDAYLFFHERIVDWLRHGQDDFEVRLESLFKAVREFLRLVVIDLGPDDDAQLIFETLNARGTPLLPSDLVKNHLFHRAQIDGLPIEKLYENYWRSFDDNAAYWRELLGRGHARRARIDSFLQNYLTLRLRDEVAAGHLYTAFRDQLVAESEEGSEAHLRALRDYAEVFRSFDHMPERSRERLFFERLEALSLVSAHPFLMELFVRLDKNRDELRAILVDLESWLVRRMVCQLNTRGYNRVFLDMLIALVGSDGTPSQRVRAFLLSSSSESMRWPADAEFQQAWLTTPAFRILVRSRVRMLLEGLERQMYDGKSELVQFGEKLTIEHLLPQEWIRFWPLPPEAEPIQAAAERNDLLHTLGNLTLLTNKLNPSVSNGPWGEKLPAILQHSALGLNRRLQSHQQWGEAAIRQRGAELFSFAAREWPHPSLN